MSSEKTTVKQKIQHSFANMVLNKAKCVLSTYISSLPQSDYKSKYISMKHHIFLHAELNTDEVYLKHGILIVLNVKFWQTL